MVVKVKLENDDIGAVGGGGNMLRTCTFVYRFL